MSEAVYLRGSHGFVAVDLDDEGVLRVRHSDDLAGIVTTEAVRTFAEEVLVLVEGLDDDEL